VYVLESFEQDSTLTSEALKRALEKLGYNVYHMEECVTRWQEKHLHLFEEATKAKLLGEGKPWTGAELDKILHNYTVSVFTSGKVVLLTSAFF
jgi:hypothetical protein